MRKRLDKSGFPRGWYCVAEASAIDAGRLYPLDYFGDQFIAYRAPDGSVRVADAYCPHLGAHLASYTGGIDEGLITCPFHKWRYDAATGACVHVPYNKAESPPDVALSFYETRTVDDMVLIWKDAGGTRPDHDPYTALSEGDGPWVLYARKDFEGTSPFPDLLENIFDTAHAEQLHGVDGGLGIKGFSPTSYGALLKLEAQQVSNDFPIRRVDCHFSGITLMTQNFEADAFRMKAIYSFTPLDEERTIQKTRLYIKDLGSPELNARLGAPFVEMYTAQVEQDYKVLNYKKRLANPKLCLGDGPIMAFRRYADRYYA